MDSPKLIVVEDEVDLRDNLTEYLALEGVQVEAVGSAVEFYQLIANKRFDIAVIDLNLPDQGGLTLVEYLRQNATMGIVILTARSEVQQRIEGYQSGADLYFVKPVEMAELLAGITSLYQRLKLSDLNKADAKPDRPWSFVRSRWELAAPDGAHISLSAREGHLLEVLTEVIGEPVSREVLLEKLGYSQNSYGSRALDALIRRLRRKIAQNSRENAPIQTVHGMGYLFLERS